MDDEIRTKVERFEDLIAWQKARKLTHKIYQVSRKGEFAKDFVYPVKFNQPLFR